MKQKNIFIPTLLFSAILFFSAGTVYSQNHAAAFAAADSSRFSVNNNGGWQLFNSYVSTYKTDSAQFELIVQHNNNLNWVQDQYVGKIKYNPLVPHNSQNILFKMLTDVYLLRVENNGKCYLHFVSGTLPVSSPVVLLFKVFYRLP